MAEESKLAEKLEEKTSEVKFTEEEMNKLKSIQDNYLKNQASFGNVKVAQLRLEEELEAINTRETELVEEFKGLQKEEIGFMDSMTKKYGDGALNPTTGVFTPNKSE